jgi:hypothetical protein
MCDDETGEYLLGVVPQKKKANANNRKLPTVVPCRRRDRKMCTCTKTLRKARCWWNGRTENLRTDRHRTPSGATTREISGPDSQNHHHCQYVVVPT